MNDTPQTFPDGWQRHWALQPSLLRVKYRPIGLIFEGRRAENGAWLAISLNAYDWVVADFKTRGLQLLLSRKQAVAIFAAKEPTRSLPRRPIANA
jgi:hypothetical protein